MADDQSQRVTLLFLWFLALDAILVFPVISHSADVAEWHVRGTVDVALACYFVTLGLVAARGDQRLIRLTWTLGWLAYVVHVGLAFHHAFGWSHAAAVAHTRERSGVGEGIYASHLFTLLWSVDVVWQWLSPTGYLRRPAWVGWLVHGYMAFIVINATVIFETGLIRWAALAAFVILAGIGWGRMAIGEVKRGPGR